VQTTELPEAVPTQRRWASIKDAAEYVDVAQKTIHQLINDGYLTAYRLGPKLVRIDLDELDRAAMRPYSKETMVPTESEIADVIAGEAKHYLRHLMNRNPVGMAEIVNASRYPLRMHFAATANALARVIEQADDPEAFLELVAEIIRRD
jgi:excisionase family DNA binding protein